MTINMCRPILNDEDKRVVQTVLDSGILSQGPYTERFENGIAAFVGSKHAVAVNSGTSGLHLSVIAAGIKPGDEVITTSMTFCATVNAIIHAGATPVLVDIDPATLNIEPEAIKQKITDRTKAILIYLD